MSKPLWFHKTKSNRIILLGPKQEDAAGGCREREGRPCAREDAAGCREREGVHAHGRMPPGVSVSERGVHAHGRLLPRSRAQNRPSRSREAAA